MRVLLGLIAKAGNDPPSVKQYMETTASALLLKAVRG